LHEQERSTQHYVSLHIYWHGPIIAGTPTPGQHRQVLKNQSNFNRQVSENAVRSGGVSHVGNATDDPPVQAPAARAAGSAASTNWLHRWVDIEQVVPAPKPNGSPNPRGVGSCSRARIRIRQDCRTLSSSLAFFAFLLIFATIENSAPQRRAAK